MSSLKKSFNTQVSFTSLKPEIRLSESIINEFHTKLGYVKSSSNLHVRKLRLQTSGKLPLDSSLSNAITCKVSLLENEIYDNFVLKEINQIKFNSIEDVNEKLLKNISEKGSKANCWEDMMFIYSKLLIRGINASNIKLLLHFDDRKCSNHFTTVFGLCPDPV